MDLNLQPSFSEAGRGHNQGPWLTETVISPNTRRPILSAEVAEIRGDGMGITKSGRYFDVQSVYFTGEPAPRR